MGSATNSRAAERPRGMRWRIASRVTLLALCAVLIQAVVVISSVREQEEEVIDLLLAEEMARSISEDRGQPGPRRLTFHRAPRGAVDSALPADLARLPVGNHEILRDGREFHVAVHEDEATRYVLVYDVGKYEQQFQLLVVLILASAGVIAVFILLGSYFLAGGLAGRLERLAAKVESGAAGPLAEPGMERELRALAAALDDSRRRAAEALESERAFATNLSHELRNPLTAIRTDAEMIAADAPDGVRRRSERIMENVDRINALAASLLVLAREANPRDVSDVPLAAMIRVVWERLAPGAEGLALEADVPESAIVRGDPAFVELVLRNTLDNAVRHSAPGRIRCLLDGTVLVITDNGPGFAADELPRVFERFYKGRRGRHGLGLALVNHACAASGWRVRAENSPQGHGVVRIDFEGSLTGP